MDELKDVKKFLEENAENKEVIEFLEGLKGKVTLETVKDAVENDKEVKKWFLSEKDSAVTKGIEGFTEKSVPKLIKEAEEKLRMELSPKETEEQKKIRELLDAHTKLTSDLKKEKMFAVAKDKLSELGLSTTLAKFVVGEDEESTLSNINLLGEEHSKGIKSAVEKEFKANGRIVHKDDQKNPPTFTPEQLEKMSQEEVNKNYDKILEQLK
jgi:hypothetical protein